VIITSEDIPKGRVTIQKDTLPDGTYYYVLNYKNAQEFIKTEQDIYI
jgi:hypothetical protein